MIKQYAKLDPLPEKTSIQTYVLCLSFNDGTSEKYLKLNLRRNLGRLEWWCAKVCRTVRVPYKNIAH